MCRSKFFAVIAAAIFLLSIDEVEAQLPKYEVGIHAGAFVYQGDLSPLWYGSVKTLRPGIGGSLLKPITPKFGVSAALTFARLAGNDSLYADIQPFRAHRAFAFKGQVRELTAMANYFPLGLDGAKRFEPYVAAGVGINAKKVVRNYAGFVPEYFNPVEDLENRLQQDLAVNPSKPQVILPVAVGARYHINNRWALGAALNYRFSLSDYVDGFSISGNPDQKDHYYGGTLGAIFKKGSANNRNGCPANVL